MSREKIYQALWAATLGFALTFGSLGCLATGMGLLSGRELVSLAIFCGLCAAAFAAMSLLRAAPWLFVTIPLALVWLWFYGSLAASAERLIYEVTSIYHSGYGWKVISWTERPTAGAMLPAFRALAAIMLLPACFAIARQGSAWAALPLTALGVAASLALTDTVPKEGFLMLYLFGAIMLLLSQSVRRRQASQGNALCAQIAIPVALALGLIFLLNPQKGYDKQDLADKIDRTVSGWIGDLANYSPDSSGSQGDAPAAVDTAERVSLENTGPRDRKSQAVMTVTASQTGRLYLRGASFGEYTGLAWQMDDQRDYYDHWPSFRSDTQLHTLTVTTRQAHSVLYLPYYTPKLSQLVGGRAQSSGIKTYSVHYYTMSADNVEHTADDRVAAAYTDLPDTAESWASAQALALIGREVDPRDAREVVYAAQAIGAYVSDSARYDLDTPKMPKGEEDFARWFLTESDTGYCVHFATAATVLLRGAGIPARYVTGYAFNAQKDTGVTVTLADAHAWVEYYIPGVGWAVLDPTPGMNSGQQLPIDTTPPATTPQATTPAETSGPEGTTEPQPTLPGETPGPTSAHSGPTESGEATAPGKEDAKKGVNLRWLKYLLWPMAILALILGQWQLRLWLNVKALRSRRGNRRAMLYWRRCEGLAAQLKETPPENIRELAQKAKFSQHKLSREELAQLRSCVSAYETRLRKQPWHKQLYYRLVLALY